MKPVRLWLGLLLVTLGAFGMLDILGTLSWDTTVSRWWPVAIITLGLLTMATERRISFGPATVTGIGMLLLAGRLDLIDSRVAGPLLLIAIGMAIFISSLNHTDVKAGRSGQSVALFAGSEIKERSQHLTHADISAIFGGATLDLREAHIDEEAKVDAMALFGGVDVLVPEGWRVAPERHSDLRRVRGQDPQPASPSDAPTLRVNATSIFGGVTVANKAN